MRGIPGWVAWFWRVCTLIIVALAIYTRLWLALVIYPLVALALELGYRRAQRRA